MFKGTVCCLIVALLMTLAWFVGGLTLDGVKAMYGMWALVVVAFTYHVIKLMEKPKQGTLNNSKQ
jgi:hypothetical protein